MKIEDQVISLDLGRKLIDAFVSKEIDVPKSRYFWVGYDDEDESYTLCVEHKYGGWLDAKTFKPVCGNDFVQAFSVAELGEMLPKKFRANTKRHEFGSEWVGYVNAEIFFGFEKNKWTVGYELLVKKYGTSEAEARGELLLWLIQNNLFQND